MPVSLSLSSFCIGSGTFIFSFAYIMSNVNNLLSKNRNCKLSQSNFLHRQTNSQRNMVELHRNYCLLIGQCLFLSVVGLKDNIDEISCTIVTFLAHLAWMSVFAWTGI